ncbi:MAG: flagellar brake protein [Betaproteobacteria bacterium]|nr:flagellar brake protein [Betaproteobacteria bacterium]
MGVTHDLGLVPRFEPLGPEDHRDYLIASRTEISRILRAAQARRTPVAVFFGGEDQFVLSRIVEVDPVSGWIFLAFGHHKLTNARLLAARKLDFACADENAKVEFSTAGAIEMSLDGEPAFRTAFPPEIFRLHRRRQRRYAIPPHGPVTITLNIKDVGHVSGELVDVSVSGIGALTYPADISFDRDEILRGCAIRFPAGIATVDVQFMHTRVVTLEDGGQVRRSGCRFVGAHDDVKALIERFFVRLSDS